MIQDIDETVQSIEELRQTSGSNCPNIVLSDVKNLIDLYKVINVDLFQYNYYYYNTVPLVTVLNPVLLSQLTLALNITIDLINKIKDSVQCGISKIKDKKNNSFKKVIDLSLNYTQYIINVKQLMLKDSLKP